MRTIHLFAIALSTLASASLFACQDDSAETDDGSGASGAAGPASGSSASNGGAGGMGSGGMATGGMANGGAGGGTGGNVMMPCNAPQGDHLLISEVVTLPDEGEYIEIFNPGTAAVDLSNHYLSDNGVYHTFTSGPWSPTMTNNTDFLARFPFGTMIAPGQRLVINAGTDFQAAHNNACPDLTLANASMCNGSPVPSMVAPPNGTIGGDLGLMLSNSREMLILFCWDGQSNTVVDIDYVAWGTDTDPATRVDKSGVTGYADDTAIASQLTAPAYAFPGSSNPDNLPEGASIGRCDTTETGETMAGGNGITGHDETSEDMSTSFEVLTTATPGGANSCN